VGPKPKTLPPVRPNAGTEIIYRRRLEAMVAEMTADVVKAVRAAYRSNPPELATDELPSKALRREVNRLAKRWEKNFADAAPALAEYYAKSAERRSARQLERILREGGFSVKFKMTKAMRDVMDASVAEQVGLIKSIPEQYLHEVEGAVMRSVQVGRDLKGLVDEIGGRVKLERKPGEKDRSLAARTFRRAALIARDQNNKATAVITRTRHLELGITKAVWLHSHAGKAPRPTHLENDGQLFDIEEGWLDPAVGKRIWPGELINCRCVSKPVVEGFS
jgi:uncharacterized protein with gpF-like domain